MAVPWPSQPLLGIFHLHQAQALMELGSEMTLFGPAPALPGWLGALSAKARRHIERPRRYEVDGVTIDAPRVPFAFPDLVRRRIARRSPEAVLSWANRALGPALDRHIACYRPDALLAHGLVPWGDAVAAAARRADLPFAFIEHSASDLMSLRPGTRLGERCGVCAARAERVFVVGPQMLDHARHVLGWPNVDLLPNGALRPSRPAPQRPPELDGRFVILAAANYYRRKGFEELIEAVRPLLKEHPQIELHLVTRPSAKLRRQAAESGLGPALVWHEPMQPEELLQWMAWADLFALPSWAEAFGLVYAEALAAGTPVLATSDSGFARYAADWARQHGPPATIVPPRSIEALSAALAELIRDPKRRCDSAAEGTAMVSAWFDWRRNAERLLHGLGLGDDSGPQGKALDGRRSATRTEKQRPLPAEAGDRTDPGR